jgi:hypothetical protein
MSGSGAIALGLAVTAGAYAIGHELANAGAAATLFLMLAAGGAFLSLNLAIAGAPAPGLPVAFGSGPALIAAAFAYFGGRRKERCRS